MIQERKSKLDLLQLAKGGRIGGKPRVSQEKLDLARRELMTGRPYPEVARIIEVHVQTLYRLVPVRPKHRVSREFFIVKLQTTISNSKQRKKTSKTYVQMSMAQFAQCPNPIANMVVEDKPNTV